MNIDTIHIEIKTIRDLKEPASAKAIKEICGHFLSPVGWIIPVNFNPENVEICNLQKAKIKDMSVDLTECYFQWREGYISDHILNFGSCKFEVETKLFRVEGCDISPTKDMATIEELLNDPIVKHSSKEIVKPLLKYENPEDVLISDLKTKAYIKGYYIYDTPAIEIMDLSSCGVWPKKDTVIFGDIFRMQKDHPLIVLKDSCHIEELYDEAVSFTLPKSIKTTDTADIYITNLRQCAKWDRQRNVIDLSDCAAWERKEVDILHKAKSLIPGFSEFCVKMKELIEFRKATNDKLEICIGPDNYVFEYENDNNWVLKKR